MNVYGSRSENKICRMSNPDPDKVFTGDGRKHSAVRAKFYIYVYIYGSELKDPSPDAHLCNTPILQSDRLTHGPRALYAPSIGTYSIQVWKMTGVKRGSTRLFLFPSCFWWNASFLVMTRWRARSKSNIGIMNRIHDPSSLFEQEENDLRCNTINKNDGFYFKYLFFLPVSPATQDLRWTPSSIFSIIECCPDCVVNRYV